MDLTNLYNMKIQRLNMELEFEVSFIFQVQKIVVIKNNFFFKERKIAKAGL